MTAMPTRPMPPPRCSDDSIGSMACRGRPIPANPIPTAAMSASSWTETGDKERSMHHHMLTAAQRRAALFCVRGLLVAGLAAAVAGCGGLSAMQRAEVLAFAQNWKRDATGGVTIERPVGGANERAASDTLKEALSIIVQAGVPNSGIGVRPYNPRERNATLRLHYPLMVADAGPCGLWPDDLGPSYDTRHFENRQYYNFGCATQHNLASMEAETAELVQPRAEGPAYTAKRTF